MVRKNNNYELFRLNTLENTDKYCTTVYDLQTINDCIQECIKSINICCKTNNNGKITSEIVMWRGVVAQALLDITKNPVGRNKNFVRKARNWLFGKRQMKDFSDVCEMAKLNCAKVRKLAIRIYGESMNNHKKAILFERKFKKYFAKNKTLSKFASKATFIYKQAV